MKRLLPRAAAALLAATPWLAQAHVGEEGHVHGFAAGLAHPFTGTDHLLAMLAVGAWGALTSTRGGRAALRAPLAFVAMLLVGALLAAGGLALPAVETMIAVSLLGLGLFVALRLQLPAAVGMSVAGAFALFHGAAHGQELQGAAALGGMLAGTVALHLAGLGMGMVLRARSVWWTRAAGLGAGLFGALALVG